MKAMENAKKQYDVIPIPKELYSRVQEVIEEMAPGGGREIMMRRKAAEETDRRSRRIVKLRESREIRQNIQRRVWAAAAVLGIFVTALNTSSTFAAEVGKLPVLGTVARILTFRSYEETNEDMSISVEIPTVEMISQDTNGLADSINEMIYTFCEQYAQEAKGRAEAYKEAFLATGGTQEEWKAHKIQIRVGYEIKSQTADYLSFVVTGTENWNSSGTEKRFYNIDLAEERIVTLEDVLGSDYREKTNAAVKEQMAQMAADGAVFWSEEKGGFAGVNEDTPFYMNESGNPVLVFEKYKIAPGSSGEITFEIEK